MRRLWLVPLVLVLGAWGPCAPVPSGGGSPMAGPTTSGLAALVAGEDWHYVIYIGKYAGVALYVKIHGLFFLTPASAP